MLKVALLFVSLAGLAGCSQESWGSVDLTVLDHLEPTELADDPEAPACRASYESLHRFDVQLVNGGRAGLNTTADRWVAWWTSSDPTVTEPVAVTGPSTVLAGENVTFRLYFCQFVGTPACIDLYGDGGYPEDLVARGAVDGWTGPPPARGTPSPP